MHLPGEALASIKKQAEECGFKEETEYPLHRKRLANHTPGHPRELCPVGAELELHGNAGDHAKDKVDAEDAPPELRSAIPDIAVRSQGDCLQYHDQ